MEKALQAVRQLVEDFKAQESYYLSADYQESQVRQDFIDKFFTALGWDVTHTRQKNPYEQEVEIEKNVKTQGSQRRADYAFFVAPNFRDVKFFAEAKKPRHELASAEYYHQAIRYAWNKKTPIAILTDFEEFHVVDCRYTPNMNTALDRKIEVFQYTDYADEEKFKRIFYLFGRDAVAAGSIEKFAADLPKPRGKAKGLLKGGYQPVDEAFLEALDGHRDTLARSFKSNNPDLNGEELTEAVQRTLDRLVFMRFLEDKQIEDEAVRHFRGTRTLPSQRTTDAKGRAGQPDETKVKSGAGSTTWSKFRSLCRRLEPKYNGLIFKPHRIIDAEGFTPPDDEQFADICDELADPTSPYDFDKIPIWILGSIYERFLGKVVRATDKRAKVEEKPEVRKAGGVYYTPEYIVRYIVQETVGKLIEGKTPDQIATMAFADIACGSGSFLLEVYNTLIEYHRRWYNDNPAKAKKADVETRDGKLVLSLKKLQEILTNNIHGVDIDFQATEVTQLSLYLRLLEDVTLTQLHLFKEKVLPDLRRNIVCGNSLIEPDIESQTSLFESDAPSPRKGHSEPRGGTGRGPEPAPLDHLKPMRFTDAFPDVMKRGGFDAIVGNPPWVSLSGKFGATTVTDREIRYLITKFGGNTYMPNIYEYFVIKGLNLVTNGGRFGYIVPDRLGYNQQFVNLRKRILDETRIELLNYKVPFPGVTADTLVFVLQKSKMTPDHLAVISEYNQVPVETKQSSLLADPMYVFRYYASNASIKLSDKMESIPKSTVLAKLCDSTSGFGGKSTLITEKRVNRKQIETMKGDSIGRYLFKRSYWFDFTRKNITGRTTDRGKLGARPKVLLRKTGDRIIATYDQSGIFPEQSLYFLYNNKTEIELRFILGILNSKAMNFYFREKSLTNKQSISQVKKVDLDRLPIVVPVLSDPAGKSRHDHIVSLVEQMLAAKENLAAAKSDADVNRLEMQCAGLDRQIDDAVYELYGLTKEEIEIVEGGA